MQFTVVSLFYFIDTNKYKSKLVCFECSVKKMFFVYVNRQLEQEA